MTTPPCLLCERRYEATGNRGTPGLRRIRGACATCYHWAWVYGHMDLLEPSSRPPTRKFSVPWSRGPGQTEKEP